MNTSRKYSAEAEKLVTPNKVVEQVTITPKSGFGLKEILITLLVLSLLGGLSFLTWYLIKKKKETCKVDADCVKNGGSDTKTPKCLAEKCVAEEYCKASVDCKSSLKPNCVKEKCVATNLCDPTCPSGQTCVNNTCVATPAPTPTPAADFIAKYEGKPVKCKNDGKIYLVDNGKLRHFPSGVQWEPWKNAHQDMLSSTESRAFEFDVDQCKVLLSLPPGSDM
jgi:hypothetical protein